MWKVKGTIKEDLVSLLLTTSTRSTIKIELSDSSLSWWTFSSLSLLTFLSDLLGDCLFTWHFRAKWPCLPHLFQVFPDARLLALSHGCSVPQNLHRPDGFSFPDLLRPFKFPLLLPLFPFLFWVAEWYFSAAWTVYGESTVSLNCSLWILDNSLARRASIHLANPRTRCSRSRRSLVFNQLWRRSIFKSCGYKLAEAVRFLNSKWEFIIIGIGCLVLLKFKSKLSKDYVPLVLNFLVLIRHPCVLKNNYP